MRKRWKRKSGYVTPALTIPPKELVKQNLFLNKFYDDWEDWRDGMRDWFRDFKSIKKIPSAKYSCNEERVTKRLRMNEKQNRLIQIRRVRKQK